LAINNDLRGQLNPDYAAVWHNKILMPKEIIISTPATLLKQITKEVFWE
jgi:hypothetical protein